MMQEPGEQIAISTVYRGITKESLSDLGTRLCPATAGLRTRHEISRVNATVATKGLLSGPSKTYPFPFVELQMLTTPRLMRPQR